MPLSDRKPDTQTASCTAAPHPPLSDRGAPPHRTAARARLSLFTLLGLVLLGAPIASASGPRWVTGPPYFNTAGNSVLWYTTSPLYFTDPANLSASVNHAAADALVAAAAGVWNVPTAAIVLAQGGTLAEHVSGADAYLTSSGPVFPADVQPSNYAAIQIAVLYDSDGSITDMLLGSGASAPAECRQNAVTEDVDGIVPAGQIQHAILVLNGRCTGSAPEQQLQMQYQLERAFGRVLGLGWSQTNDNVFTRMPQPTTVQAQNWPILHPIDILCGAYSYQCLPSPFTLRDDDVAAISGLYPLIGWVPLPTPTPAPGKIWTYIQAGAVWGYLSFPTGEGMQGVNVVLRRWRGGTAAPQPWDDVSAVTGFTFQQNAGNPVTGTSPSMAASMGSTAAQLQGYFLFAWIPDADPVGSSNGPMLGTFTTEPINPLYVGAYAVGPYIQESVSPSGAAEVQTTPYPIAPNVVSGRAFDFDLTRSGAASICSTSADGTESSPAPVASTGWWNGVLCAHGHIAWSTFSAQANRTATLEVTALDESGYATTAKSMPLIGVWAATDPTGTLPTVAATPSAFNTIALGTTAVGLSTTQAQSFRFVLADARGDGRPDYAYQARVLYADSVQPALTSIAGGQITITGMGFRPGNSVTINGVPAIVSSWTANTIVAIAPPQSAFAAPPSAPVTIAVTDLTAHGSTIMSSALTYSGGVAPDLMALVSAPSGTVPVGVPTPVPFAVRVTLGDGVTPVVGLPVTFTWTGPASSPAASRRPAPSSQTRPASPPPPPRPPASAPSPSRPPPSAHRRQQPSTPSRVASPPSSPPSTSPPTPSSPGPHRSPSSRTPHLYPASKSTGPAQPASPSRPPPPQPLPTAWLRPQPPSAHSPPALRQPLRPALGPPPRPPSAPPSPSSPSIPPPSASSSSAEPASPSPRPPPSRPSSLKSPTPPAIPSRVRLSISTRPSTPPRCPASRTAPAPSLPRWPHPPAPPSPTSTASSPSRPCSSPQPPRSPTSPPPPAPRASPPSPSPSNRSSVLSPPSSRAKVALRPESRSLS